MKTSFVVEVSRIERLGVRTKAFTLIAPVGTRLPGFSAGSHVLVTIGTGEKIIRNAYSLISDPRQLGAYRVAVQRSENSRGGSAFLHDEAQIGEVLVVDTPENFFPLAKLARKHVLLAGGIGITPIFAHALELTRTGQPFELHYAFRDRENATLRSELESTHRKHIHFYCDADAQKMRVRKILEAQPLGTHLYVCGPYGLIRAALETARLLGWPDSHCHCERFTPPPGTTFRLHLKRSARSFVVEANRSILETLEAAGLTPPNQCRGGACGKCEAPVLEGAVDHLDNVLSDSEKKENRRMMICVSRANCDLVLDL